MLLYLYEWIEKYDFELNRVFFKIVLSCHYSKICQKDSPHQNAFKLTLSRKSFYVFRKDRQCKFIFLLSPSLDLINIISVWALEAMKVASKTLQRSWHTLPAAGSYLQPWINTTLQFMATMSKCCNANAENLIKTLTFNQKSNKSEGL